MQNSQERFHGLFIPYVTPFDESGALDIESLERLTNHFASLNGVAGLVSCARIGRDRYSRCRRNAEFMKASAK